MRGSQRLWIGVVLALAAPAAAQDTEVAAPKDVLVVTVASQPTLSGKYPIGDDGAFALTE